MTQQTEKNGPRDEPRSVGYATKLAMAALVFAALSAGVALCINYVHYQTWAFVPPAGFGPFHRASGVHDASMAAVVGFPNLVVALLLARRGLPGVAGGYLWVAAALAVTPWVATPPIFLPLQASISEAGPTPELLSRLVGLDLLLRASPVVVQTCILLWATVRSLNTLCEKE